MVHILFEPFFIDSLHTMRKCSANYRKARKLLSQKFMPWWRISGTRGGLKKKSRQMLLIRGKDRVSCEMEVCAGDSIHKVNQPGQVLCAWCHEIIWYGCKGKIAHHHSSQENFPRTSLCPRKSLIIRAPNDAWFACLSHTRTEIHPLQACPVCGIDPLNWQVRGVFTL